MQQTGFDRTAWNNNIISASYIVLNRASLTLQTIRLRSQAERLAWLAEQLVALPGHGIIYTLTVRNADQVAAWLLREAGSGEVRPIVLAETGHDQS